MRRRWIPLIALLAGLTLGCEATIPEGRFDCREDQDCPDGWFCRDDDRCYATPEGEDPDAGP